MLYVPVVSESVKKTIFVHFIATGSGSASVRICAFLSRVNYKLIMIRRYRYMAWYFLQFEYFFYVFFLQICCISVRSEYGYQYFGSAWSLKWIQHFTYFGTWIYPLTADFRSGSDVQRRHSGRLLPQGPVYRRAVRVFLSRLQL
jgi:hypothetical protein